jgi:hypothetical protein
MSPSLFGWIAISAIVLCLYLPSEGRRSASRDTTIGDGRRLASNGPRDSDGTSSDDSGSDDSGKDDSDD